jgi:hypothetical protein
MRDQLFFHVRKEDPSPFLPHTYCVKKKNDSLVVGYSIVHEKDTFCRKVGRQLAENKANILSQIDDRYFKNFKKLEKEEEVSLPESISFSIYNIVQKSGEIMGLVGRTKVLTFISSNKRPRTPVMMEFEIVPVTPTQVSNDIMHSDL